MLGWGVSVRLQYQQVTEYVPIEVAATTVRVVASTATDCNTGLDVTFTPSGADAAYLVAAFVQGNTAPQVKAFVDERVASSTTSSKLRAIHAAYTSTSAGGNQAAPVDFYVAGVASTTSLFDDVSYGATAAQGNGVDANGYLSHDPFAGADLRVRLHASLLDVLDAAGFSTTPQHVYSLFTTGVHAVSPNNAHPMQLLVCDDSAASLGHLGLCTAMGMQL
jgi:hypothetical protein